MKTIRSSKYYTYTLLVFVSIYSGCGEPSVPVSGKILFDGKPGRNISVLFQGESDGTSAPPAAIGFSNERGEYSLSLIHNKRRGAYPGNYAVCLVWIDPEADPSPLEGMSVTKACPYDIPEEATSGALRLTVPEKGTKNADFIFETKPAKVLP